MRKAKQTLVSLYVVKLHKKPIWKSYHRDMSARYHTRILCSCITKEQCVIPGDLYDTYIPHPSPRLPAFIPGGQSPSCDVTLCHMQTPQNESTFYQSLESHVVAIQVCINEFRTYKSDFPKWNIL